MSWKFLPRQCFRYLSRFNGTKSSTFASLHSNDPALIVFGSFSILRFHISPLSRNPNYGPPPWDSRRNFTTETQLVDLNEDANIREFLSRFVWIMRKKLKEAYPESEKKLIDAMLFVIVERVVLEIEKDGGMTQKKLGAGGDNTSSPAEDFSDDLWKTVWDVSNWVLNEMQIAAKKEKMKKYLHCDVIKKMYSFASEIGIRGELLRELWYKWAREEMEIQEAEEALQRHREAFYAKKDAAKAKNAAQENRSAGFELDLTAEEKGEREKPSRVDEALANRRGVMNYKIYGLDLSGVQWRNVADKIHEMESSIWPQQPKAITGKCSVVTNKIMAFKGKDDPSPLFAEWSELLHPTRADWLALLDRLKNTNRKLYLKAAELVLSEESFQADIGDYSKLINTYAKSNSLEDAERVFKKMTSKGIAPDITTYSAFIHMYSMANNLEGVKQSYDILRQQGFKPGIKIYKSVITAYIADNQLVLGESLLREMEMTGIKPTKDIYMALLRAFAKKGDGDGTHRVSTLMQFAGMEPCSETHALVVEAYARAGDVDEARTKFDYMRSSGHRPDDACVAMMVSAYKSKNSFDRALSLILDLEKDGIEPGVKTLTVLLDWFCRLMLMDEAEQILNRMGSEGGIPTLEVHVSLCEMYSIARLEKKMRRSLSVLEARKEEMGNEQFERVVIGLYTGGYVEDAERILAEMDARGFTRSPRILFVLGRVMPFRN